MPNEIEVIRNEVKVVIENEYAMLKDTVEALEVNDDTSMKSAGDFRAKVNTLCKTIEERRAAAVKPFNALVKEINAEYKTVTVMFDGVLAALDAKCKPYLIEVARKKEEWAKAKRAEELAKIEENQRRLESLATSVDSAEVLDMALQVEEEKNKLAAREVVVHKSVKSADISTALIDNWKGDIVNDDLVPRQLCSADPAKIKAVIKANIDLVKEGKFEIAGVKIWNDQYLGSYKR